MSDLNQAGTVWVLTWRMPTVAGGHTPPVQRRFGTQKKALEFALRLDPRAQLAVDEVTVDPQEGR